MTTIDIMKQALEVLERASDDGFGMECDDSIIALRAAIEAVEKAKPAAWQLWKDGELYAIKYDKEDRGNRYSWVPLYTHPAPNVE